MRLRLRLLLVLLLARWRPALNALDTCVLRLRVLPNDVDVRRITNDRYLALMDLGRLDLTLRIGLFRRTVRKRWVPVVSAAAIRYRHPLSVFQRYDLRTRLVWWDQETFYFQQEFVLGGRVTATGYVCATMLGPDGPVSATEVLREAGPVPPKPSRPDLVPMLDALRVAIREEQSAAESSAGLAGPDA